MGNKPSSQEQPPRQYPQPQYTYTQPTSAPNYTAPPPPQPPAPYLPSAYQPPGYQNPYNHGPVYVPNYPAPMPAYNQYPSPYVHMPPCTFGQPPRGPTATATIERTETVKNQVNLKKQTLKAIPVPSDPTKLSIQFSFDASAACRVTIFYVATEEVHRNCHIIPLACAPGPPVMYDKGMDRKFPPEDSRLAAAHQLNTAAVPYRDLSQSTGEHTFPLIIRLEALTDRGREAGRSLESVEVGGSLPPWVQSQTTYAKFVKEGSTWSVRVLKQKIWVEGEGYELQEIYGMEGNRANAASQDSGDIDGRECVICMSEERNTTVLPCRHLCMCDECARALRNQTNKCPICRNPIEALLRLDFQNQSGANSRQTTPPRFASPSSSPARPSEQKNR